MKYKDYEAVISFDDEVETFRGEVAHTKDVITFQGKGLSELRKAFKKSVDEYLDLCKERGEEPEKPFSGVFVIRIKPELHRKLSLAAKRKKLSLNALIEEKLTG